MSFESYLGAVVEAEAASGASQKALEEMIAEIIGIFKDPVILYPGGWEDSLPPTLWEMIRLERLVQQMKAKGKKIEESTDAEAMAYLYSASLVAPMSNDWASIYMWLGRDLLPEGVPRDQFVPKALSSDQQRQLDDLKRWIYRKKTSGRKSIKPYPLEKPSRKKKARKLQPAIGDLYGPEIIEAEY
jgi:hypothetical protein